MTRHSLVKDSEIITRLKNKASWLAIQRELRVSPVRIAEIVKKDPSLRRNPVMVKKISPSQVKKIYNFLKAAGRKGKEWMEIYAILEDWMQNIDEVLNLD